MQFIELLAARLSLTRTATENIVNQYQRLIYDLLREGTAVNLSGFGKFEISHRQPREGVNPRTMERIVIPELNVVKFRGGESFKKQIN
jgi:DNA-binding protein HU-beta